MAHYDIIFLLSNNTYINIWSRVTCHVTEIFGCIKSAFGFEGIYSKAYFMNASVEYLRLYILYSVLVSFQTSFK